MGIWVKILSQKLEFCTNFILTIKCQKVEIYCTIEVHKQDFHFSFWLSSSFGSSEGSGAAKGLGEGLCPR